MAVEWVAVSALVPWAGNPRDNAAAVPGVKASIERFGFGAPVVARRADGEVIAGHTRLQAAIDLGLSEVPVRWLDLSADDAHALALADNKLGELAEWDASALDVAIAAAGGGAAVGFGFEGVGEPVPGPDVPGDPDPDPDVVVVTYFFTAAQAKVVEAALVKARAGRARGNGPALALVCEAFCG
jgi:site-specific DNA-methyltransferase (adenine-specific)